MIEDFLKKIITDVKKKGSCEQWWADIIKGCYQMHRHSGFLMKLKEWSATNNLAYDCYEKAHSNGDIRVMVRFYLAD